jgi:hypothetical protein
VRIYRHLKPAVGEVFIIESVILNGDFKGFRVYTNQLFLLDKSSHQVFEINEDVIRYLN